MSSDLNEKDIKILVNDFYTTVRKDDLLAPIFASKITKEHWPEHMDHIANFWGSIFLKTKRFNGTPMQKHLGLKGLSPSHFERWLSLFRQSANRTLSPEQANMVHSMAERIAQSLQMGLALNFQKTGKGENPFSNYGLRPQNSVPHI